MTLRLTVPSEPLPPVSQRRRFVIFFPQGVFSPILPFILVQTTELVGLSFLSPSKNFVFSSTPFPDRRRSHTFCFVASLNRRPASTLGRHCPRLPATQPGVKCWRKSLPIERVAQALTCPDELGKGRLSLLDGGPPVMLFGVPHSTESRKIHRCSEMAHRQVGSAVF